MYSKIPEIHSLIIVIEYTWMLLVIKGHDRQCYALHLLRVSYLLFYLNLHFTKGRFRSRSTGADPEGRQGGRGHRKHNVPSNFDFFHVRSFRTRGRGSMEIVRVSHDFDPPPNFDNK